MALAPQQQPAQADGIFSISPSGQLSSSQHQGILSRVDLIEADGAAPQARVFVRHDPSIIRRPDAQGWVLWAVAESLQAAIDSIWDDRLDIADRPRCAQ